MALAFKFTADSSDFSKEMENLKKSTGNTKKELRDLTKEITALERGYRQLSDEEKKSAFGQHLQEEIQKGLSAAADLKDTINDVSDNITKLSSDVVLWEGMAEAIKVTRDVATAFASSLGIATKEGSLMGDTINTIAKVQGIANAAITIGNALQKNSKLMSAITTLQYKAQTAATNSLTASTGKLTVAQRMFNTVAKMNPYILLASAIATAVVAIGSYVAITNKSSKEAKQNADILEKQKEANEHVAEVVGSAVGSVIADYNKMKEEYKNLSSEHEKTAWLDANKSKFEQMGLSVKTAKDLEDIFVNNTEAVVKALKLRAQAEALFDIYKEHVKSNVEEDIKLTQETAERIKLLKEGVSLSKVLTDEEIKQLGLQKQKHTSMSTSAGVVTVSTDVKFDKNTVQSAKDLLQANLELKKTQNAKDVDVYFDEFVKKSNEAKDAYKELGDLAKTVTIKTPKISSGKSGKNDIDYAVDSLVDLENRLEAFKKAYKSGLLPKLSKDSYLKQVQELETEISQKKIELGLEMPKSQIEQLNEELKKAKKDLEFTIPGSADEEQIKQNIREILEKIEKENLRLTVQTELKPPTDAERAAIQEEINNIVNDALKVETPEYDFSNLPDEFKKSGDELIKQIDKIKSAQEDLQDKMNDPDASDAQISAAQEGYKKLGDELDKLREKADVFQELSDATGDLTKHIEDVRKTCSSIADVANAVGSAFNGMADAFEMPELNVFGTIAQSVANMALSYSTALTGAASMGPWAWVAFAATGLAQLMAIIASVKNATKFEEGGIVGGSSFTGDKLLMRINSGEMILNKKQQESAWNLMNSTDSVSNVRQQVEVFGKIRGADIYLSQDNYKKISHKK